MDTMVPDRVSIIRKEQLHQDINMQWYLQNTQIIENWKHQKLSHNYDKINVVPGIKDVT